MTRHVIFVDEDGLQAVYHDDLAGVFDGEAEVRRASHVEPVPGGGWDADMTPVGGPASLGPFALREQALAAEAVWLENELKGGRL